ncbi:MAG TPA: aldolase/citrate lyase family protein [Bryobacteraceae bacterium]|nr:aldolase/citrate lyase family protein [Bryobacteraceae bacterium]
MSHSFAQRLRESSGWLGSWCTFASFASTEVMAQLGFDFLILDLQHCELTQADFPAVLGAFRQERPAAVVRAPANEYHIINWLFDQGVAAVLVPMVNSAEDARRAVEAAKFPPLGRRSFGPYRASHYSFRAREYMAEADQQATLIVQIESAQGAREAGKILAVPGVDAVFMGPNDLAFSLLKPGESLARPSGSGAAGAGQWTSFARTPEVLELCDQVRQEAMAAGIPFGMTAGSLEEARHWFAKGANFMTVGCDFLFLSAGAREMLPGT